MGDLLQLVRAAVRDEFSEKLADMVQADRVTYWANWVFAHFITNKDRDWLSVNSRDNGIVANGFVGAGGYNKRDAIAALQAAIIRLAEGGDVSPDMREAVAIVLRREDVRLVPCRGRQGNKSLPERDFIIHALFNSAVEGGNYEATLQSLAEEFDVTPRAIEQAIQRSRQRVTEDETKPE
jgi:hypothetical protein